MTEGAAGELTGRQAAEQRFALLSDEPVDDPHGDLLDTGPTARRLADLLLASRASTPFTLAVDAGWGAGKSSLMKLVDAELGRAADVHTAWYNAWTSTGADALEGLIKSVLMSFDRRVLRRALHRVSERRGLVQVARALTLLVSGPLGAAGLVNQLWQDLSVDPQARNQMRDALRDLTMEWAETAKFEPNRLLVVFIDDLDRCSEEAVLAVCEAVKVYLDVPGLAFVVGCDRSALGPSGLLRDLSPAGSAFMEKVFQTSYRVPAPSEDGIREYVRHCAERSGIGELLDDRLRGLVAERSARNPRRIKRLINGFVLESGLNPVWRRFGPEAVIRTLLLQHLYADFYRTLVGGTEVGGNAVGEFLGYRSARQTLRPLGDDVREEAWGEVVRFFVEHEVPPPARTKPDGWEAALAELEQYLPSGFPALAVDRDFVSLVEELVEVPDVAELIGRLRRQPARTAIAPDRAPEPKVEGPSRPDPLPLSGLHILWIDDHPDNNTLLAAQLERLGATVHIALERERAERALGVTDIGLVISDIQRGTDRSAGFDLLARWRSTGRYDGPAAFYSSRITPHGEARAAELQAEVYRDSDELFSYVAGVAQAAAQAR
ncbi:MAG TPA: P-loop NTPase fold protein, partial [Streptomyces sp.]|nr:P-loop NTPase fold protein [Streptomyces sp.]